MRTNCRPIGDDISRSSLSQLPSHRNRSAESDTRRTNVLTLDADVCRTSASYSRMASSSSEESRVVMGTAPPPQTRDGGTLLALPNSRTSILQYQYVEWKRD